jgi:hypothetical protein
MVLTGGFLKPILRTIQNLKVLTEKKINEFDFRESVVGEN